jgi:hypothetical protein
MPTKEQAALLTVPVTTKFEELKAATLMVSPPVVHSPPAKDPDLDDEDDDDLDDEDEDEVEGEDDLDPDYDDDFDEDEDDFEDEP